jgi:hypothetical protein
LRPLAAGFRPAQLGSAGFCPAELGSKDVVAGLKHHFSDALPLAVGRGRRILAPSVLPSTSTCNVFFDALPLAVGGVGGFCNSFYSHELQGAFLSIPPQQLSPGSQARQTALFWTEI